MRGLWQIITLKATQATLTKPFPLGSNSIFEGDAPSKVTIIREMRSLTHTM